MMFGKTSGGPPGASARQIKTWARELFDPAGEATILVSELACSEPGCPPVETVIAIFRAAGDSVKFKIHRPSAEISRGDLAQLLETAQ